MDIRKLASDNRDYVIELRQDFHENPEVSGQEYRTMEIVKRELESFGLEPHFVEKGGIVAVLKGNKEGKKIVLRADMDGLRMCESPANLKQDKTCVSKIPDAAHTCGHDAHTAILLGTAKILSQMKDDIKGEVIFAFEQGEELSNGLLLSDYVSTLKPDGIFALHMKTDLPAGTISVDAGPRMAGKMEIDLDIIGQSGHGSRPDLSNSPLDCFVTIYQQIKDMRINKIDPFTTFAYSICHVECGSTSGIIPEKLRMEGSFRYTDYEVAVKAEKYLKQIVEDATKMHHCKYEYNRPFRAANNAVINNKTCSDIAKKSVVKALGEDGLISCPMWMASEPLSLYFSFAPGVFAFLGTNNPEKGTGAEAHNIHFDVDEDVLELGVATEIQYVFDFLEFEEDIPFTPSDKTVRELIYEWGREHLIV